MTKWIHIDTSKYITCHELINLSHVVSIYIRPSGDDYVLEAFVPDDTPSTISLASELTGEQAARLEKLIAVLINDEETQVIRMSAAMAVAKKMSNIHISSDSCI